MPKRAKFFRVVSVAILTATVSCVENAPTCCGSPDGFVAEFLAAVADKDEERLIWLAGPHPVNAVAVNKDGQLTADVRVVLYEGDTIRRNIAGGRSIAEILALGDIVSHVAWDDETSALLMFLPRQDLHRLDDPDFYRDEWMKTYFACLFRVVDGDWRLGPYNFCYASTDGPFPGDIG